MTLKVYFIGLSASCRKTYAFRVVRVFVRVCVCVRACVTPYLENRASDFSETLHTKLYLDESEKNVPSGFLKKTLNLRIVDQCENWSKNQHFMPYFQTATSDFDETWPKVAGYGLSSYGIGLYPGKILDLEIIHLIPLRTIGLRKLQVFKLRYEQKLYLILLGESNGMKIDPYM